MCGEGHDQDDHLKCREAGDLREVLHALAPLACVALLSEALALELALLAQFVVCGGYWTLEVHQDAD